MTDAQEKTTNQEVAKGEEFQDAFVPGSAEATLYDILKTYRDNFGNFVLSSILKAAKEAGPEFELLLNKPNEKGNSFASLLIPHVTMDMERIVSNLGSLSYPYRGLYVPVDAKTSYVLKAFRLVSGDNGWPVIGGYYPGATIVRIQYKQWEDVESKEERIVSRLRFFTINSTGELSDMIWYDDSFDTEVRSALEQIGIGSEDFKENADAWFLITRENLSCAQQASSDGVIKRIAGYIYHPFNDEPYTYSNYLADIEGLEDTDFSALDLSDEVKIPEGKRVVDDLIVSIVDKTAVAFNISSKYNDVAIWEEFSEMGKSAVTALINALNPELLEESYVRVIKMTTVEESEE